jgi:hypothetical protein
VERCSRLYGAAISDFDHNLLKKFSHLSLLTC